MKIKEILTEAPAYPETGEEIKKLAKKAGYEPIGSGFDAEVYQHPEKKTDKVIKILLGEPGRPARIAKKGFLAFYKFTKQHPNHPNLPKFGNPTALKLGKETVVSVPVEPLYKVGFDGMDKYIHRVLNNRGYGEWEGLLANWEKDGDWWITDPKQKSLLKKLESFHYLLQDCVEYADDHGLDLDLHGGNVMKRADGTPVLTDPFVVFS